MLTERATITQIMVLEDGQVQVQRVNKLFRDGIEIAREEPHRHVVHPGQDLSREDIRVQVVCSGVHTPEVIEAYLAEKLAQKLAEG